MKQLLKTNKITLTVVIAMISFLLFSCKKQEKVFPDPPHIIKLEIRGSTVNDTLQFVKSGKVIAESGKSEGEFGMNLLLTLDEPEAEIQIRKKGQTDILATRKIVADKFEQVIRCYYNGEKAYDETILLKFKGYSGSSTLQVLMDGRVICEGGNSVYYSPSEVNIGFEPNQKHQIQIRNKATNAILLTKEISGGEAIQNLRFYFDGFKVHESINFPKPSNPANILFTAKFTSALDVYNGPIDIVFFSGISTTKLYEHTATNIRIEIPTDGSFSQAIELPPAEKGITYSYKLVKRGTLNDLPYILTNELMPIKPESSYRIVDFRAGYTLMADIMDRKNIRTSGITKGTSFSVIETDIKFFFDN
ncbi:hypothetical protein FBD94_25100 [Pedobacter hiemivivus]|uniref:Uncharacterized protein n=1 Tax=Pedobacter hiemivivus TaxID=2530454 RepID=A0A4V5PBG8_9SPHI|nr:hypothetical protein [Pedobacter hiemivivus]TKC55456.1 hypothetical protein FBD94_25100 [Pedobacter hiemivivus]